MNTLSARCAFGLLALTAPVCAQNFLELPVTAIYRKMMIRVGGQDELLSPTAVQDRRKRFSPSEEAEYQHIESGYTIGTPEQCRDEIETLAKAFGTDEITVVTVTHDFAARVNSYTLLANALR